MPPARMLAPRGKSLTQLIAEESVIRAERRRQRLEEIDRFARAFARESRRDEAGEYQVDLPSKPLKPATRAADDPPRSTENVTLHADLEANGIHLSHDEVRELSPSEQLLLSEVHRKLKDGWFTKQSTTEPIEQTDHVEAEDDGAAAIAAECSLFLGVFITADHVRRSWAGNKRLREIKSDLVTKRKAKSDVFSQRP